MRRPPIFNVFTHMTLSHQMHGYWRHPKGQGQMSFYKLDPWIALAKTAERACFDTIFFADTVGVYTKYQGGWQPTAREGMQFPGHDASAIFSALGYVTENLGLIITSSVLQDHPFSFARRMSTLDHVTDGRIGWNVVTSYLDNAARNFGYDALAPHDARYDWAEEYLDVVYKLWEASWEDDALLADPVSGLYADPNKIHPINHVGARYRVEGPHLTLPSPQRTPVLFQAGASEAGRSFSARHAEATFLPALTPHSARRDIADIRRRLAKHARDPDQDFCFLVSMMPIVGSTEEEARRKEKDLEEWLSLDGILAHLSGSMGVDLSDVPLDQPIGDLKTEYGQGGVRALLDAEPNQNATFADLIRRRLVLRRRVGTPEQICDHVQQFVDAGVGGFNIIPTTTFGWFEEFADHVVPRLQERGLMQRSYAPGTLREKLLPGRGPFLPSQHPARQKRATWKAVP
jgi:FMN-dependent oxidoreductase (nitrilotriacetate monooxygenase family)